MFIVGVLIVCTVCAGQAPPKKPAPARKTPAAQSTFVCPDAEAQQGCKSYQELLKAKDEGLPQNGYICFRKKADEFFVVSFSRPPYFIKHWNQESKQMEPDNDTPHSGIGYTETYKDGVLDSTTMPHFNFSGQWTLLLESPNFTSDRINFKKQDESDHDQGISIDATQFNAVLKYENKLEKTVRYTLTIQRSTGRFAESFRLESEKIPFSESTGYCVYH